MYRAQELTEVRSPEFASRIRLQTDARGQLLERKVVLMFHGLLNSPEFFQRVEDQAYKPVLWIDTPTDSTISFPNNHRIAT